MLSIENYFTVVIDGGGAQRVLLQLMIFGINSLIIFPVGSCRISDDA